MLAPNVCANENAKIDTRSRDDRTLAGPYTCFRGRRSASRPCTPNTALNNMGTEKKMLITSIFSFSHNIFYPVNEILHQFINHSENVVCKFFGKG